MRRIAVIVDGRDLISQDQRSQAEAAGGALMSCISAEQVKHWDIRYTHGIPLTASRGAKLQSCTER